MQCGKVLFHHLNRLILLQFCQDAHSDAVWWGSFSDFVSNSIVAFLLVGTEPMHGFIACFIFESKETGRGVQD